MGTFLPLKFVEIPNCIVLGRHLAIDAVAARWQGRPNHGVEAFGMRSYENGLGDRSARIHTYEREIECESYASAFHVEHRKRIEEIHLRVTLLLQVEAESIGGAAARMSRARFEEVTASVLEEDDFDEVNRPALIKEIAKEAEIRLVFLVEPEPDKFGLEIRSLQEFLVAAALINGRDSDVIARLQKVSGAPMLRNTLLFAASRLYSEPSPLREQIPDDVCSASKRGEYAEILAEIHASSSLAPA